MFYFKWHKITEAHCIKKVRENKNYNIHLKLKKTLKSEKFQGIWSELKTRQNHVKQIKKYGLECITGENHKKTKWDAVQYTK